MLREAQKVSLLQSIPNLREPSQCLLRLSMFNFFIHSFVQVMVRMRKMCEEIAEGRYTIPEVGIDVDNSLVLFLTLCMEVSE